MSDEEQIIVGPPISLDELRQILEAGFTDGVDGAFRKHIQLVADKERIKKSLQAQREKRTVRVKSNLP